MHVCLPGSGNPFGADDDDEDEDDMPSMGHTDGSDNTDDVLTTLAKACNAHDNTPITEVKPDVDNGEDDENDMPAVGEKDTSTKDMERDGGVACGDSDDEDEDEADMPAMSDISNDDDGVGDDNNNDKSHFVDTHVSEDATDMPPLGPRDTDFDARCADLRAQRAIAQTYGVALDELQCMILCSGARIGFLSSVSGVVCRLCVFGGHTFGDGDGDGCAPLAHASHSPNPPRW